MVDLARLRKQPPPASSWIPEDPQDPDGPAFLLAPLYTPAFLRYRVTRLQDPHYRLLQEEQRRQLRMRQLGQAPLPLTAAQEQQLEALETELLVETLAQTVLLDWRGQTSDDEPTPYSLEVAIETLTASATFRDFIVSLAGEVTQRAQEAEGEATKNCAPAFGGP